MNWGVCLRIDAIKIQNKSCILCDNLNVLLHYILTSQNHRISFRNNRGGLSGIYVIEDDHSHLKDPFESLDVFRLFEGVQAQLYNECWFWECVMHGTILHCVVEASLFCLCYLTLLIKQSSIPLQNPTAGDDLSLFGLFLSQQFWPGFEVCSWIIIFFIEKMNELLWKCLTSEVNLVQYQKYRISFVFLGAQMTFRNLLVPLTNPDYKDGPIRDTFSSKRQPWLMPRLT